MRSLRFQPKLFCQLTLAFILFIIVNTLSYFLAYWAVAETIGIETHTRYFAHSFYYAAGSWGMDIDPVALCIYRNAGLAQGVLTAFIGSVLLLIAGKRFRTTPSLNPRQWLIVFLAFFWLRPAVTLLFNIAHMLQGNTLSSPETYLADSLNRPPSSVYFAAGITGIIVLLLILFYFIPTRQRLTFMVAALAGGPLGWWPWYTHLGPAILP